MNRKRFYIFLRAFFIVSLTTANIWLISHKIYYGAIIISAAISIMWTLNVKDLAIADKYDRGAYVLGGIVGTAITLYTPVIFGVQ